MCRHVYVHVHEHVHVHVHVHVYYMCVYMYAMCYVVLCCAVLLYKKHVYMYAARTQQRTHQT